MHHRQQSGFTLIELTISLTVISVLVAAIIPFVNESHNATADEITKARIAKIEMAMQAYQREFGDLPCPADATALVHTANFGVALTPITSPQTECPVPEIQANRADQADVTSEQLAAYGAVPTKTLDLPDEYGFDGWGRRLSYHVSINNISTGQLSDGIIEVVDHTGTVRTDDAAYVVVSHGPNGHGAFTAAGTRLSSLAVDSASEITNAYMNSTGAVSKYTGRVLVAPRKLGDAQAGAAAANVSDDVVFTRTQMQIAKPVSPPNVYCWGDNSRGSLGNGTVDTTAPTFTAAPTAVPLPEGEKKFISFDVGDYYNCAIGDTNTAYCWGANDRGQLGVGDIIDRSEPTAITNPPGVSGFTQVMAAGVHTCALANEGDIYCWGARGVWLGLGFTPATDVLTPQPIVKPVGVSFFTQVSASGNSSCALGNDGKAYCWGRGFEGQFGNGTPATMPQAGYSSNVPVEASFPAGVTRYLYVITGSTRTCGIGNNGKAYCWGDNNNGALGLGFSGGYYNLPQEMDIPSGVFLSNISFAFNSGCAQGSDARAYCWGRGNRGQLGVNSTAQHATPVNPLISNVIYAYMAAEYACGVVLNGGAFCWGRNEAGQLGIGSAGADQRTPVQVALPAGFDTFDEIYGGTANTCAWRK